MNLLKNKINNQIKLQMTNLDKYRKILDINIKIFK